jgi:hypothetical protein
MPLHTSLLAMASALLFTAGPCQAAGNRLLPFWGQPYPTGYVYRDFDPIGREPDCRPVRLSGRHHGHRALIHRPCGPVLHARD